MVRSLSSPLKFAPWKTPNSRTRRLKESPFRVLTGITAVSIWAVADAAGGGGGAGASWANTTLAARAAVTIQVFQRIFMSPLISDQHDHNVWVFGFNPDFGGLGGYRPYGDLRPRSTNRVSNLHFLPRSRNGRRQGRGGGPGCFLNER